MAVQLLGHYAGLDYVSGRAYPPDTVGAAGPTSYIETANSAVAIFMPKNAPGPAVTDSLFHFLFITGGLPHASATSSFGDATMVWDDQVQRFIIADIEDDFAGHSAFPMAVSKSASPATLTKADWNFYTFNTSEAGFSTDYPGNLGYNRDAFVWTLDMFAINGVNSNHTQVNAVRIDDLVNGVPAPRYNRVDLPVSDGFGLRPTAMHDSMPGDAMWFIKDLNSTTLRVYKDTDLFDGVGAITRFSVPVAAHGTPVPPMQPDGTTITTNIIPFILKAAEYNNNIVAAQTISVSATEDDARWYRIDVSSGTPRLADQGNVGFGPGTFTTYPGIDINPQGLIGMSFMESGLSGPFLSTYITGRLPGDPAGTMETPVLVQAGARNMRGGRAGDFSGISVDTDGTFWIANEVANTQLIATWGTTIAHFSFFGPTVTAANLRALEGIGQQFDLGSFADTNPGSIGPWTVTVDWGDGTPNTMFVTSIEGPLGSKRHSYAKVGTYTVTVTIIDSLNLVGSATYGVDVAYSVSNLAENGDGSLRHAVLAANADAGADQISFAPDLQGMIVLTSGPLSVADDLTIEGPGVNRIAVSGDDASRVFDIAAGVTAKIDGLTITHGRAAQGGGIQNAGLLTLSHVVVSHNLAAGTDVLGGGGILNLVGATLVIADSTLSDNVTTLVPGNLGPGGGLDNEGTAAITACIIAGNQAVFGAGVFNDGTLTVKDSTFTSNRADGGSLGGFGGGFANGGGMATVLQSTFTGNIAIGVNAGAGGAIYNTAPLTLTSVMVNGNLALGGDGADGVMTLGKGIGGGIYTGRLAELIITGSQISGNLAQGGNGGNNDPDGSGNDSLVDRAAGGGIYYEGGVGSGLTILNCMISSNQSLGGNVAQGVGALAQGGGVCCVHAGTTSQGGSITISGSLVAGNTAIAGPGGPGFRGGLALGGGVAVEGDRFLATDVTVAGNIALGGSGSPGRNGGDGLGGGIYAGDATTVTFQDVQIIANQADGGAGGGGDGQAGHGVGGGVYVAAGATATADTHTIVAGNRASTSNDDVFGIIGLVP